MDKYCKKCDSVKPRDTSFFRSKDSPDGFSWYCKECVSAQTLQWAKRNPRKIQKISHKYSIAGSTRAKRRKDYQKNKEVWHRRGKKFRMKPEAKNLYRRNHLQRKYGITPEMYEEMLLAQAGVCFICKKSEDAPRKGNPGDLRRLAVDHDHETGRVRKLLCHKCNTVIGLVGEDPLLLQKLKEYLFLHE